MIPICYAKEGIRGLQSKLGSPGLSHGEVVPPAQTDQIYAIHSNRVIIVECPLSWRLISTVVVVVKKKYHVSKSNQNNREDVVPLG